MATQRTNNRKQGQRIRRIQENVTALINTQEAQGEVLDQHDRDLKMVKARLAELERQQARHL